MELLKTKTKDVKLPVFFPDATHAVIKSVPTNMLSESKIQGLVINTYHAMKDGIVEKVAGFGGLHNFTGFKEPIITDSGGFQVMSLIHRNRENGKITDEGIKFKQEGCNQKIWLTPENCIDTQIKLGSDILMCLDDCTDPEQPLKEQEKSVERTIRWAKRCKYEFDKQTADLPENEKPLIFAIVQGGNVKELRRKCAEELIKIGFDGYAYGGWPVDGNRVLLEEILNFTANLMPNDKPKYAMGVGKPSDIVLCYKMSYNMFDCVLPTRDARHQRLYTFKKDPKSLTSVELLKLDFYDYLYIGSGKYSQDTTPISQFCDCSACSNFSKGYINHLFKVTDVSSLTLATLHNLRFYSQLMDILYKLDENKATKE